MKRILIIRPDSIGDFIIFSAVIEEYTRLYTGSEIDLACDLSVRDLADTIPFFKRKFYVYGKRTLHVLNLVKLAQLSRHYYDLILYPVYSRTRIGDFLSHLARGKEKITFDGDDSNVSMQERLTRNHYFSKIVVGEKQLMLEHDRNCEFLLKIGADINKSDYKPRIWFQEKDEIDALEILKEHKIEPRGYYVIFPGSGLPLKCWPAEKWVALISTLLKNDLRMKIIILGGRKDENIVKDIITKLNCISQRIINLQGQTSLRVMAKIIAISKCLISIDTCAIHMAATTETPNVCIMGGGHFGRFYPYGDIARNRIAFSRMECFGCNWMCRYSTAKCITTISPEYVFQVVREAIE